jgi:hypothetical protein
MEALELDRRMRRLLPFIEPSTVMMIAIKGRKLRRAAAKDHKTRLLEPISKSFEEDDEAGQLDKSRGICGRGTPSERGSGAAIESRRRSVR